MDQNAFQLGLTITLLAALIMGGNMARAEQTQEAPASKEIGVIGGSVSRSSFTLAVVNHEPKDAITELTNDQQHIYFFTELKGMAGQNVIHRWMYNGKIMAETTFNVGNVRWRVWSSKTLQPEWLGKWAVLVINDLGQTIHSSSFNYLKATTNSTKNAE